MGRRIVAKFGTSVLTSGGTRLDDGHMAELVRQCVALRAAGHEVIVCTSGAIAAGRERMDYQGAPTSMAEKQMLAAVGQAGLMHRWERLFEGHGVRVGQVLLTRADVTDRPRYLNARDALQAMLAHGVVPVINENDAVATAEIRVGDNDNLSALAAMLTDADLLVILTDQEGLFTGDPRTDPDAALIPMVERVDEAVRRQAGGRGSDLAVGGMATKIEAAETASRAGIETVVARGHAPDVLPRIVAGEACGTRFSARGSRLEHRRKWLLAGPDPAGRVRIDSGAQTALVERGSSLLAAGVTGADGPFERGDIVAVLGPSGSLGRGLVRYDAGDVGHLVGCRTEDIADRLGENYGPVVIHRNDMILA